MIGIRRRIIRTPSAISHLDGQAEDEQEEEEKEKREGRRNLTREKETRQFL